MVNNEVIETDELNKQAEEVQKLEDAADLIKQQKNITRIKKKGIINIAFHQGKVFKKFKDKEKFITIVFKINVFKLIEKYLKLMKSSIGLGFLKYYYKDIKEICNENSNEFT